MLGSKCGVVPFCPVLQYPPPARCASRCTTIRRLRHEPATCFAAQAPLAGREWRRIGCGCAGPGAASRGPAAEGGEPPAAVAGGATKPLPAYAAWKAPSSLIVHSSNTIETRRSAFGTGVITPSGQLYVRNNLPVPDASILTAPHPSHL